MSGAESPRPPLPHRPVLPPAGAAGGLDGRLRAGRPLAGESMVRHQPLQYYEPQLCLSCLTGIYGCRWKRYQRSHDDTTPVSRAGTGSGDLGRPGAWGKGLLTLPGGSGQGSAPLGSSFSFYNTGPWSFGNLPDQAGREVGHPVLDGAGELSSDTWDLGRKGSSRRDTLRGRAHSRRPQGEQKPSASWQLGRWAGGWLEGRVRRWARPSRSLGAGRAVAWPQGSVT